MADEILTVLSKVSGVLVIARSSSLAYRDMPTDVRRVAKDLGVRYVVEGSVRKSGNRIRIVAQLSDGATGSQLWAERYDEDAADVFATQDDVARKIVAEVTARISPLDAGQWPGIASAGTTSTKAYACFLRGRAMQRGATQNADVFRRTSEFFREAIAHDPCYPAPYAALGMAFAYNYFNRWTGEPTEFLAEAGRLADRAIELDPAEPFSHGVAALVAMYRRDFQRWASEVEAALSLNPNFAPALSLRGLLSMYSGSPRAAIRDLERAMRLDPLFTQAYLHHLAVAHLLAGDYETAAALLKERILLVPETDMSRAYLSAALGNLGYVDEARRVWDELIAINPAYSFAERIAQMPFKNRADLARIERGLSRAGLLDPSSPRADVP